MKMSRLARDRRRYPARRRGRGFERAHHGRAHGHDPPTTRRAALMAATVAAGTRDPLGMHSVVADVVGAHRLESAGADMQREARKSRRRRFRIAAASPRRNGDRRSAPRPRRSRPKHGLVPLAVRGVLAPDVRRQRQLPCASRYASVVTIERELVQFAASRTTAVAPPGIVHHRARGRRPLLARACARIRRASRMRSSRSSQAPAARLAAWRRAGSTRVSFTTSRSPGRSSEEKSANRRSRRAPPRHRAPAGGSPALGQRLLCDQFRGAGRKSLRGACAAQISTRMPGPAGRGFGGVGGAGGATRCRRTSRPERAGTLAFSVWAACRAGSSPPPTRPAGRSAGCASRAGRSAARGRRSRR